MEEFINKYPLLKNQNVPRGTFIEFESFIAMLQNLKMFHVEHFGY